MPEQADANEPGAANAGWVKVVHEAAFSPRDTAEDAVFRDRMWISNGYYHGNILTRDLWSSVDGADWQRHSEATPYDGYSEMTVYDDQLWAVKGSVWSSVNGTEWRQVLEQTPFGVRGYGELVVHRDRMWQLGSGEDVWHSTDGCNWTCAIEQAPYGKRSAAAVVVFAGKLWVMGGTTRRPNTPPEEGYPECTTLNDVWCSADGADWTCVLEHAPWSTRQWFIAKVYRDCMWIIGGYDNVHAKNLGDVWYTRDGVHWSEFVADPVFEPRHEPTCYVYDDSLWVVAGNTWPVRNDAWRLTLPPDGPA